MPVNVSILRYVNLSTPKHQVESVRLGNITQFSRTESNRTDFSQISNQASWAFGNRIAYGRWVWVFFRKSGLIGWNLYWRLRLAVRRHRLRLINALPWIDRQFYVWILVQKYPVKY